MHIHIIEHTNYGVEKSTVIKEMTLENTIQRENIGVKADLSHFSSFLLRLGNFHFHTRTMGYNNSTFKTQKCDYDF